MPQPRSAPLSHPVQSPPDKLALLRNHALFGTLSQDVLQKLGSYMKRRKVARGSAIFAKGDPGSGLMGVLSGKVRISVPSVDGREIVLNIINPGEVFGEIALLDGHPRTADAIAMTDCELMIIERREFIPFVRGEPDLMMHLIEILCARLRATSEQVQDVSFLDLPTRLAKALLRLGSSPEGSMPAAGRRLAITQREISQIIGRSRESTNKQLRSWEKQGWIRLQRSSITVLNPDKLATLAAEGSEMEA